MDSGVGVAIVRRTWTDTISNHRPGPHSDAKGSDVLRECVTISLLQGLQTALDSVRLAANAA